MKATSRTFSKLVQAASRHPSFIDSRGGTRSGKTYAALQLLIILAETDPIPRITSVVSRALPHLKQGAIRDFKQILIDSDKWNENAWNATECFYKFPNGSIIEFFGVEATGKVYGPARDRLFANEGNFIDWETMRQLIARTKGLVIYDYNPSAPFWGTDELPKMVAESEDRLTIEHVHSTYKDNPFLPAQIIAVIESNKSAKNWWRVYGLGEMGQIEGQIFDFKVVDKLPDLSGFYESYGMDFGFTNDPTTLIHAYTNTGRREVYADALLWQTGMTNPEIADALKGFGITNSGPKVYADCAEPKSIEEIKRYGLNVVGCDKKASVAEQVQHLQAYTIYVTRRSTELLVEGQKYLFKQRADGTFTNEPIDFFNHGIDALRYAVYSPVASPEYGQYSLSVIR